MNPPPYIYIHCIYTQMRTIYSSTATYITSRIIRRANAYISSTGALSSAGTWYIKNEIEWWCKVINRILLGGYGYARVTGPSSGATAAIPGTPPLPAPGSSHHHHQPPPPPTTSAQAPPPPQPHDATDPRQYTSPMPPPARPPSAMSKLDTAATTTTTSPHPPHSAPTTTAAPSSLCEIDPQSVPANMKMEGQDWFALYVSCLYFIIQSISHIAIF